MTKYQENGKNTVNEFFYLYEKYLDISKKTIDELLNIDKGNISDYKNPEKLNKKLSFNKINFFKNLVVCYNSKRNKIDQIKESKTELLSYLDIKSDRCFYFDNASKIRFILRTILNKFFFHIFFSTLKEYFINPSSQKIKRGINLFVAIWVYNFFENKFKNTKILVLLFTSNNRLSEILRIWSLTKDHYNIEILHGICTETYEKYYSQLHVSTNKNNFKLGYVNLSNTLPQPYSIQSGILFNDGLKSFSKRDANLKIEKNIIILGSSTGESLNKYINSNYFLNESLLIRYCKLNKIPFKYICHPKLSNKIAKKHKLKKQEFFIGIKKIKLINCHIVGHFSTALFEHNKTNNIYILEDGFKKIRNNIKNYSNKYKVYSLKALMHEFNFIFNK